MFRAWHRDIDQMRERDREWLERVSRNEKLKRIKGGSCYGTWEKMGIIYGAGRPPESRLN